MVNINDYIIELDGRRFVTYSGLLLAARDQGLMRLTVRVVQPPTPENEVAIVEATAEMRDGRTFCDLGDASAASVRDPQLVPHILRIASTRAKPGACGMPWDWE